MLLSMGMNCKLIPSLIKNHFVERQIYVDENSEPENRLSKANIKVSTKIELRLTRSSEGKKLNHRSLQKTERSRLNAEVNLKNDQRDQLLTKLYAIIDKYLDPQKVSAQTKALLKKSDELNQKLPELAQLERRSKEISETNEWAELNEKSVKLNEKKSQSNELAKVINDIIGKHNTLVDEIDRLIDEHGGENENFSEEDFQKKIENLCNKKDKLYDEGEDLIKKRESILAEAEKLRVEIMNDPMETECLELANKICEIERMSSEADKLQSKMYDESFKFFMDLVPEITDAVERGVFDEVFIKGLSKRIDQIRIEGFDSQIIVHAFERMLNGGVRRRFISNLNRYAQRISGSKTAGEKQSILKKRDLFVYNTLIPPYQRLKEGSCFISAMLIKLWHDSPIEYMQIIYGIIEHNRADLGAFQTGLDDVDVSAFGQNDTEYHVIYEKLVSAFSFLCRVSKDRKNEQGKSEMKFIEHDAKFASAVRAIISPFMLDEHRKSDHTKIQFKSKIADICNKLSDTKAQKYIESLRKEAEQLCEKFSNEFVWNHDRWAIPTLCQKPGESEEKAIKRIESLIKNDGCPAELAKDIFHIFKNVKVSGGTAIAVMGAMESLTKQKFESYSVTMASCKNCVIQKNVFQQVLDIIEYGNHFNDRLQKLSEKQLVMGTYHLDDDAVATDDERGDHFFNFIPKHYDVDGMKEGERVKLGYLNYPHALIFKPVLYLAKLDNDQVQLQIFNGKDYEPLGKGNVSFVMIYPGFMTQYEDTHLGMGQQAFQILKKCINTVAVDFPLACLRWLFGEKLAKLALKCSDVAKKNSAKASG